MDTQVTSASIESDRLIDAWW